MGVRAGGTKWSLATAEQPRAELKGGKRRESLRRRRPRGEQPRGWHGLTAGIPHFPPLPAKKSVCETNQFKRD